MFKNIFHTNPEDSQKINPKNTWEIDYWSSRLHITQDALKNLIKKVGTNIKDIKKQLPE